MHNLHPGANLLPGANKVGAILHLSANLHPGANSQNTVHMAKNTTGLQICTQVQIVHMNPALVI